MDVLYQTINENEQQCRYSQKRIDEYAVMVATIQGENEAFKTKNPIEFVYRMRILGAGR